MRKLSGLFAIVSLLSLIPMNGADDVFNSVFKELQLCCEKSAASNQTTVGPYFTALEKRSLFKKNFKTQLYFSLDTLSLLLERIPSHSFISSRPFISSLWPSDNSIRAPPSFS